MLGVADEYNMCLFDIEVVEMICMIMIRYVFIPLIQIETPKFKEMMNALLEGLSPLMPHMSYDLQMFLVKRIVGVPGYQYHVDLSKEKICRNIFTNEELTAAKSVIEMMHKGKNNLLKIYDILFSNGIPVTSPKSSVVESVHHVHMEMTSVDNGIVDIKNSHSSDDEEWIEVGDKKFKWIMKPTDDGKVGDWQAHLHDTEFFSLSKWDQLTVRWLCDVILKWNENSVGRYFCEMGLNVFLFFIRRYYSRNIAIRRNG